MTMVTNAVATYGVTTNREDLVDTVYRISPADTPFISAVPRTKATSVLHEWPLDTLDAVNTSNAALEGDTLSRSSSTNPARVNNYCQISQRDATVTGTQRAVNPAGIKDMMAFQMAKKSLVLRKDIEAIVLGNQGQNAGSTTVARNLRSLNAWFNGTAVRGTGGADSTAATAAATDATTTNLVTFTEALLKTAIKNAYVQGGEPDLILVGPVNKQTFSGFTGRSNTRVNIGENTVQAAATVYASDFGDLKVVPSRTQRSRDVFVIDTSKIAIAYLRAFEPQDLGRVGDADTRNIIVEYTLENRAPLAHSGVLDTNG